MISRPVFAFSILSALTPLLLATSVPASPLSLRLQQGSTSLGAAERFRASILEPEAISKNKQVDAIQKDINEALQDKIVTQKKKDLRDEVQPSKPKPELDQFFDLEDEATRKNDDPPSLGPTHAMMHSLLSEVQATRAAIAEGIDVHALEKKQAATLDMQKIIKEDVLASEKAMEENITKTLKEYIDKEIKKAMEAVKNETQTGVVDLIRRRDLRLNERGLPSDKVGNLFLRARDEEEVEGKGGGVVVYDLGHTAPPAGSAYINFALALKGDGVTRAAVHVREKCLAERMGTALKKLVSTAKELTVTVERIAGGGLMVAPALLQLQAHEGAASRLRKTTDLRGGTKSETAMFVHFRAQVDVASFQEVAEAIKTCEGTCMELLEEWKVAKGNTVGDRKSVV